MKKLNLSSKDENRPLNIIDEEVEIKNSENKNKKICTFIKTTR